jgi:hypothetical protein
MEFFGFVGIVTCGVAAVALIIGAGWTIQDYASLRDNVSDLEDWQRHKHEELAQETDKKVQDIWTYLRQHTHQE